MRLATEVYVHSDPTDFCPTKAHPFDAAFDLYAAESAVIEPGLPTLVPTGVKVAIPVGHVGLVCSRSGLALKRGLFVLNAPGVIDPNYRGEIGVILASLTTKELIVRGDRIAQLLIVPTSPISLYDVDQDTWGEVKDTERGTGGFGSTGD